MLGEQLQVKAPSQSAMDNVISLGKKLGKRMVVAGCVPQGDHIYVNVSCNVMCAFHGVKLQRQLFVCTGCAGDRNASALDGISVIGALL